MKKAKSLLTAGALVLRLVLGSVAFADQTIDGRDGDTSGDVEVNGIIGSFDNTTPGPDPENPDEWINVTIPTKVLFYTTEASNHQTIESPTYNVTNNSAKGVIVEASQVSNPQAIDEIDELKINSIELIKDGAVTLSATELFELGDNTTGASARSTFSFNGSATPVDPDTEVNPTFNLVLSFEAVTE